MSRDSIATDRVEFCLTSIQTHKENEDARGSHYHDTQCNENAENACVNQNDMQFGSPYSRLLHWITYSRNISVETKEIERRTCPLLWCRNVCFDQQELFDHVRNCPFLSNGVYWCSICSKPEELHNKAYQAPVSDQLSQKELSLCILEGVKEIFHTIGIGYVSVASRRAISLPAGRHLHSRLDELRATFAQQVSGDRLAYELEESQQFSFLNHLSANTFTRVQKRASSHPTQACGQIQNRNQKSLLAPSPHHTISRPPRNLWMKSDWTSNIIPANSSNPGWPGRHIVHPSIPQVHQIAKEATYSKNPANSSSSLGLSAVDSSGTDDIFDSKPALPAALSRFSDSTELVRLFWDILQEHVSMSKSKSKIGQLHEMTIIQKLMSMSPKEIAMEGFRTLQLMLNGKEPTSLSEIYAFVHVAYTSLTFEENATDYLKEMFVSVSQLGAGLKSQLEKKIFEKVANAIWSVPIQFDGTMASFHQVPLKTGNVLIQTCERFLDLMERNCPPKRQFTEPSASQNEEFFTIVKLDVTVPLISTVSLECFVRDVAFVEKLVERGDITSIRQLELELMWTSKISSQSELLYNRFLRTVSTTCDVAHSRLFQRGVPRTEHHIQDITIILETILSIEEQQASDALSQLNLLTPASPISISHSRYSSPSTSISSPSITSSRCHSNASLNTSFSSNFQTSLINRSATSTPPPPISSGKSLKCPICGYEPDPSGIQKWKAGNLKRHMKSTHNGKRYECTFGGCGKVFVGRKDNLLSHQRDKGHLPLVQSPYFTFEEDIETDEI